MFWLKWLRQKALRIKQSKNNSNKLQNLKTLGSKHHFLLEKPNPKNTICVTTAVQFMLDLMSDLKRYKYFVDLKLSYMSESGIR